MIYIKLITDRVFRDKFSKNELGYKCLRKDDKTMLLDIINQSKMLSYRYV